MKRKLYSLLLSGIMMLAGQAAWADLQQNENGAYLIGSKSDLQAWSEMSGYESTDVVLTGDIEGLDFMLCTNSASYNGTFDGAGHTVTLNYDFQGKQTGMFYNFAGTVKNLVVGGSIRASFKNCAALAAWNWSDNAKFEHRCGLRRQCLQRRLHRLCFTQCFLHQLYLCHQGKWQSGLQPRFRGMGDGRQVYDVH